MRILRKLTANQGAAFLLIAPCMLLLFLMMVYPVYQTLRISVSAVKLPNFGLQFIGMDNFSKVFADEEMPVIFLNTLTWIAGTILLRFFLGFWAAIAFHVNVKGKNLFRLLCLLPWTIPSIVAANLWRWIFQSDLGMLNGFLKSSGLNNLSHNWLGDPDTAIYSVIFASAWSGFPFVMLMLLAGMQGIPKEMYEAGAIDGANKYQLFRFVTIPSLKPIIVIVLLLEVIGGLNQFDMIYTMTGGGPGSASEILGLYVYRKAFTSFDFGSASAISVTLLFLAIIFFVCYGIINNKANKRGMLRE